VAAIRKGLFDLLLLLDRKISNLNALKTANYESPMPFYDGGIINCLWKK